MHNHRSMISAALQGESSFKWPLPLQLWYFGRLMFQYGTRFLRWGFKQYTLLSPSHLHALLGYSALLYGLLYGYRVVIADRFQPAKVLELIEREHVNAVIAAPTMMAVLLNSQEFPRHNLSSLLLIIMASAPCPADLARRVRSAFGCPVLITFGTTEVGGMTLATNPFDPERLQTETVGRLFPGIEAKVVDEVRHEMPRGQAGELALRLPSAMRGYYKAPEITTQALDAEGWYYTGDLATMDEQGYVRIVGRQKDMIIRGGQNVYPAEIENHLLSKPGIQSVAVVGVPDPLAGERVWAFVVPQEGVKLTPADVLNYCRGELAPYKVPDQVRIVDSLPMTATGKVQKFALRDMVLQEQRSAGVNPDAP
jgi:acyl-CoA synthetase (AMP-forming)/AMP-acid ligase II